MKINSSYRNSKGLTMEEFDALPFGTLFLVKGDPGSNFYYIKTMRIFGRDFNCVNVVSGAHGLINNNTVSSIKEIFPNASIDL